MSDVAMQKGVQRTMDKQTKISSWENFHEAFGSFGEMWKQAG